MADGRLLYVVGPSGAGKDSAMRYARDRVDQRLPVVFSHRYITRPPELDGENHVALSTAEFQLRKACRLFVMDWESHGCCYGIGTEINYWLAMGLNVVVNGSRGYLGTALEMYPDMKVIWITADPELMAVRLARRGRESKAEIASRLRRVPDAPALPAGRMVRIRNDGPLALAGEQLVAALTRDRV